MSPRTLRLKALETSSVRSFWPDRHPYWEVDWGATDWKKGVPDLLTFGGVLSRPAPELLRAWRERLRTWAAPPEAFASLDALERPESLVVITGQQPGFLGGPWFNILKVASAIRCARELSETLARPVIPVFWMVEEDHDLAEANWLAFPDQQGAMRRESWTVENFAPGTGVGTIPVDHEETARLLALLSSESGKIPADPEFLPGLLTASHTWGEFLARLLLALFGKAGLVPLSTTEPALKQAALPFIECCVEQSERVVTASSSSAENLVSRGLRFQIKKREVEVPFFLLRDGRRVKGTLENGLFTFGEETFLREKLLAEFRRHPESFSAGVLANPPLMSATLPVVLLIGGQGEAAYHVQLREVYPLLGLRQPWIAGRPSLTLAVSAVESAWQSLGAPFERLLFFPDEVLREKARDRSELAGEEPWHHWRIELQQFFQKVATEASRAGAPVDSQADQAFRKSDFQLQWLREKIVRQLKRLDTEANERLETLRRWCLPGGKPQERALSAAFFLHLYGPKIAEALIAPDFPWEPGTHVLAGVVAS